MNLTLQQRIAVAISILWVAVTLSFFLIHLAQSGNASLVSGAGWMFIPPIFILWISGALKPLIRWFKGDAQ